MDAVLDRNTKNKVANNLASNIMHDEDDTRAERAKWNPNAEKISATNGTWNS